MLIHCYCLFIVIAEEAQATIGKLSELLDRAFGAGYQAGINDMQGTAEEKDEEEKGTTEEEEEEKGTSEEEEAADEEPSNP